MKKLILFLTTVFLSLMFTPSQLVAETRADLTSVSIDKSNEEAKAKALIDRLIEIRDMDVSKLTSTEKSSLRKEIRSIRDQLKMINGGLYISFGLIIIILLLIILI